MIRPFIFYSLVSIHFACLGQLPSQTPVDMEAVTDHFLSFPDDDTNYEDQYENLAQVLAHPLELNSAKVEDLRSIRVLAEEQIQQFILYRDSLGPLLDIYELQSIPTFNIETIERLLPFVIVKDPHFTLNTSIWNRVKNESSSYLILRTDRILENKLGFSTPDETSQFKGSPYRMYTCFRTFRAGDFSIGMTIEKDAGERWAWKPVKNQYGADYLTGHVQIQNKGRIKNLIIGNFQSQFAQGITYGGLFGMGKSGETILSMRKSDIGFLPYTSAYESGSFRGLATTVELKKHLYVSALVSSQLRDANITTVENKRVATSRILAGLHRNERELQQRKNLRENTVGIIIQHKTNKSESGLLFNSTHFNKEILLNETVYNQNYFQGKRNVLSGAYFNYTLHQASFFSEFSASISGDFAVIVGTLTSITRNLDLAFLYRKYSPGFTSFYTNAIAENSSPRNESGMYWGWKYKVHKKIVTTGYMDIFQFPWLRYRSYRPSDGHEWLLRLNYTPSRQIDCFIQVRNEQKERNVSQAILPLYHTTSASKTNYWFGTSYDLTNQIRLKTRMQFSTYSIRSAKTSGMALVQDLQVSFNKLKLTARYALFDTDDYDNRQYVYENDVWLAYSLPALSGVGTRHLLQAEYKLTSWMRLWARLARLQYHLQDEIGTGLEKISGDTKTEVKFQVMFSF